MVTGGGFVPAEESIMRKRECKLNLCNVTLEIKNFSSTEGDHLLENASKGNTNLSIFNTFRLTFEFGPMLKQQEKC